MLSGPLDEALEAAAEQVAIGFGVDRCVISVRGDSTGGAAVGAHTWDSLTWNQTADYCRIAAAHRRDADRAVAHQGRVRARATSPCRSRPRSAATASSAS